MKPVDQIMMAIGEKPVKWYIDNKKCIRCRNNINYDIMNDVEKHETTLSGYCKMCQDNTFNGKSDPPGTDTSIFDNMCDKIMKYIQIRGNACI